jgi:C4-dicarboxylate transporter DctQ subunit
MNKKIINTLENISGGLFLLMILMVLYQVFMRKIVNASPNWTEELARYAMIWSILVASPVMIATQEHIMLDYFIQKFPLRMRKTFVVLISMLMFAILGCFTVGGAQMILTSIALTQNSPGMQIPMWITYIILPLSGIMMVIAQIIVLLHLKGMNDEVKVE